MQRYGLKKVYEYLDADPDKNMIKVVNWAQKVAPSQQLNNQVQLFRESLEDPENNWYRLIRSLWTDIDDEVRKTLFNTFVLNANFDFIPIREELSEKYDCNIPWAILMDPTSACNLKCTGCWAAEYGNKLNMSFDTLDSIINQGKELGIHMYIYSGGEPLMRKKDIIALCNKHNDCAFLAFTNGTLIDEEFAQDMLRVKNFVPAISVEGFESGTDFRRGKGTFAKIEKAMNILREHKLPFGISCCYTSQNVDQISSEAYFDWMVDMGAKFCWFFTYMPIGKDAPTDLLVSAEQRAQMYHSVRAFRETKPLFTMDFWNDGEYVGGCIAGGRNYLHINANGDIEPCAFIHYADANIYEDSLLEALQKPLFQAYRSHQPFNENHLRPCPLLDNPGALTEMIHATGAGSTDLEQSVDVEELSSKCKEVADNWAVVADQLWSEGHYEHAKDRKDNYYMRSKKRA
ncbi:MAG TPA: radical SAM protein [Clostridiaceae bacterium]|nr:radical SAM protein [Clostridiaceae bacterium]